MVQFQPVVQEWFRDRFGEPTEPQSLGWPAIQRGENVLIAAPTGSGKTLAAFLCAIDRLVGQSTRQALSQSTQIVYISPLKALANDIRMNLLEPLEQIQQLGNSRGLDLSPIQALVRTGDTLARERARMTRTPPHILVTTPESLFILLTSRGGRTMLKETRTVIVDEIHALARDKRGAHLSLSLERLEDLTGLPLQRIGLSATQKPIREVAGFLTGPSRRARIIDVGHRRKMDLAIEVPGTERGAVISHETWDDVYNRITELIEEHRSTLVFVNTRRLTERLAHQLAQRLGESAVQAHHGSLSREIRLDVESRLKRGKLKAVVATASLELGIDVGWVDLVCQVGSTRNISLLLQRVGRSGHWKGAIPKGRIFPTTRDELLECAALVRSIHDGTLDRIIMPRRPLDILAQQMVAAAASREWGDDEMFTTFRRSASYRDLSRQEFDRILAMLSEGISTSRGRRGAYLHWDRIRGRIRPRRGAGLVAMTSGGAIPDRADFLVKEEPEDTVVGTLDEDFAVESSRGDIFLLGSTSWQIQRVESGTVRVRNAQGAPPTIPFWRGEAPGRTWELSESLSRLREEIVGASDAEAEEWLRKDCGLDQFGAIQAIQYVRAGAAALKMPPTLDCVVAERFFDESGGMQLVVHAPFGTRLNRAWGLALRKRFCRSFNFELQAAATDNGILVSLSDQHSFPLETIFSFLSTATVKEILIQALLDTPLFGTRWRWNACRALAVPRFAGGRKVPPPLQRMRSDDLLASVFPEQAACQENIQGDIEIPDHPLVRETLHDCLTEATDIEGLEEVLASIETGNIRATAVDTREPSPFSHEILNANPYAFLDDAPLEERRARAVRTRRNILPEEARELCDLDPAAIREVSAQAWPTIRDADELHDAFLTLGLMEESEVAPHPGFLQQLLAEDRVRRVRLPSASGEAGSDQATGYFASAERVRLIRMAYPGARFEPEGRCGDGEPIWERDRDLDHQKALTELVRSRLDASGPVTCDELCQRLLIPEADATASLHALEAEGHTLRGRFRPGVEEIEWCERGLLARIHRMTLGRLRRRIAPVTAAQFMRFLFRWQHLSPASRLHGEVGLSLILEQLQGYEAPAASWEMHLLRVRLHDYEPPLLDRACLSGLFTWGRLSNGFSRKTPNRTGVRMKPSRLTPISFFRREEMDHYLSLRSRDTGAGGSSLSHPAREVMGDLERWGASFLEDLVRGTGRLPLEVEEGLWELVRCGLVTADGFDNLRAIIDPSRRRGPQRPSRRRKRKPRVKPAAGRWTLLRGRRDREFESAGSTRDVEPMARQLLKRWGVVFRDLLAREPLAPSWRDLVQVYRRLEARGEIRGGRFVAGFYGEQFSLPEALEALRACRRLEPDGEVIRVSTADPLNLAGIILPGNRVRPTPGDFVFYRDGLPVGDQSNPPPGLPASAAPRVRGRSKPTFAASPPPT